MLLNQKVNKICGVLKAYHNILRVTLKKLKTLKEDLLKFSRKPECMRLLKEVILMS